jgi:hypothetical protein
MKIYQHYKNNKFYEIVDYCLIQREHKWIEAVVYKRCNYDQKFCRSLEEFEEKFKEVRQ